LHFTKKKKYSTKLSNDIDISITQNASHGKDCMVGLELCARVCAAEIRTLRFVTPVVFNYSNYSICSICV